jgi:hypothetical protein
MRSRIRPARFRLPAAVSAAVALLGAGAAVVPLASSASPSIGSLQSRLNQAQSRAQSLSASTGKASDLIARFDGQIALVTEREAAVQARLSAARAVLGAARAAVSHERAVLRVLVARLSRARQLLSRQLVSQYESAPQNIVSVVLQARGFKDLLDRLQYLHMAEKQEKAIVHATMLAKAGAESAAAELTRLEARDQVTTDAVATEARAIAGMNALLRSKRGALYRVRAIQFAQLQATRSRQSQLSNELSAVEAQQAAANSAAGSGNPVPYGGSGASGGWAIPYAIVLCESGGQNLTPNSAGASGYYQILPSTWRGAGGSGPAAYLAPKSEQDRIASILWNNGAGASNWVCSGIVGIH